MGHKVHLLSVFAATPYGGNPAPIVPDAVGMSDADMQDVARIYGLESGFVLPAPTGSGCDFIFRFWVPNHEMEMCGHATVGALWLLQRLGQLPRDHVSILTKSGRVNGRISTHNGDFHIEITQPRGRVQPLPINGQNHTEILSVLGITSNDLAPFPIQNASTSRIKTLIPLKSASLLDELRPDFGRIEVVCERIGSTGLYPYAPFDLESQTFDARQFPKSSGYPEDAATGIAAAALSFGLLENGIVDASDQLVRVRQGRAMGHPSEIFVRFRLDESGNPQGCWLGGSVRYAEVADAMVSR